MNIRNLKKAALVATVAGLSGVAGAANIVGAQSAQDGQFYIRTGSSNVPFGPHRSGKAGIGVSNAFFGVGSRVDFAGLTKSSKTKRTETAGTTVYELKDPIPAQGSPWYKFHRDLGVFSFVKVGSGDVWIGEWSRDGAPGFDGRQVYYVGDAAGTTMPQKGSGIAEYTTYGINKFTGNNLMTGTLTANFNEASLKGTIANSASTLKIDANFLDDNNNIVPEIKGSATFDNVSSTHLEGRFFGNQAASFAGIAEFADKNKNTAFGGTKN